MNQITDFGMIGGKLVRKVGISNDFSSAAFLAYGASLISFIAYGVDVIVSSEKIEEYDRSSSYMGQVVGPFANRIKNASFTLDGKTYELTENNNGNCLHSGVANFGVCIWNIDSVGEDYVVFSYESPKDVGGFPGRFNTRVKYSLSGTKLIIEYEIKGTEKCPINLTNHAYFNLNGYNSSVLDHSLFLNADEYVEVDSALIPTGIRRVDGSAFDFRSETRIRDRRDGEYDHCFLFADKKSGYLTNGKLKLLFETDLPGIQVYTGKFLNIGSGKDGNVEPFGAIALETEFAPDSPNNEGFPSFVLDGMNSFRTFTSYEVKKADEC